MSKQYKNFNENFSILRSCFILEIEKDLNKINKKNKISKSTQKYKKMILGLHQQLKNFEIKNEDLKINFMAFERIRRDEKIKSLKWWFIAGLIVFFIAVLVTILLKVFVG